MKFCPYCGTALNDDMRFCPKCGTQYIETESAGEEQVRQAPSQSAGIPKKKSKFWNTLLIVAGVIAALWFFGIISFDKAPTIIDPTANYETDYNQGVSYYERKDYSKAQEYFLKVDEDYKNTHLYLILCAGHIRKNLTDEQVSELKRNLDFCDTKSLFMSEPLAVKFLNGYWANENGTKFLEFFEQGDAWNVSTNLDNSNTKWADAEGFYVKDGMFGLEFPIENKDDDSMPFSNRYS